jgi:hypothetical protein
MLKGSSPIHLKGTVQRDVSAEIRFFRWAFIKELLEKIRPPPIL